MPPYIRRIRRLKNTSINTRPGRKSSLRLHSGLFRHLTEVLDLDSIQAAQLADGLYQSNAPYLVLKTHGHVKRIGYQADKFSVGDRYHAIIRPCGRNGTSAGFPRKAGSAAT